MILILEESALSNPTVTKQENLELRRWLVLLVSKDESEHDIP